MSDKMYFMFRGLIKHSRFRRRPVAEISSINKSFWSLHFLYFEDKVNDSNCNNTCHVPRSSSEQFIAFEWKPSFSWLATQHLAPADIHCTNIYLSCLIESIIQIPACHEDINGTKCARSPARLIYSAGSSNRFIVRLAHSLKWRTKSMNTWSSASISYFEHVRVNWFG